jgi:cytochrome b
MVKIRVWDLPTRLFHIGLALSVIALVITGNMGGDAMVWHFRFGYTVLTLLTFRLVWGFLGGHWSRWSSLPLRPRAVMAYLFTPSTSPQAGHNPIGSLSVLALLSMLFVQVATGLISDDEISTVGPFVPWVSSSMSSLATHWHTETGKLLLLLLIALHLLAIWFYRRFKKQHLTQAMVLGDQWFAEAVTPSRDDAKVRWLALAVFSVCAMLVYGFSRMAP